MTLPTRPDGGIDWDAVQGVYELLGATAFGRLVAAHARERCAKWHDEQAKLYDLNPEAKQLHIESSAAIRKMED